MQGFLLLSKKEELITYIMLLKEKKKITKILDASRSMAKWRSNMSLSIAIQTLLLILMVSQINWMCLSLLVFVPIVKSVERITQVVGLDGSLGSPLLACRKQCMADT